MSSESFSSMSESDMIEGSAVNAVLESQMDRSISHSLCQGSSASVPPLNIETDLESPMVESQQAKRPKSLMKKVKELINSPAKSSLSDLKSTEKLPSKKLARRIPNVSRFYTFKQKIQDKIEKHRELKRQEEEKQCTFKPIVHSKQHKRTPKEVYRDMMRQQSHRDQRLKEMQEIKRREEEICQFQPSICGKSKQIMQSKSYVSEKCHERLYGMFRKSFFGESIADDISRYSEQDPFSSQFIPRVSRLSRAIKNKRPIAERLYADALRRCSIEPTPEISDSPHATASTQSTRILIEGFLDEIAKKTRKLDPRNTGRINYYKFIALFNHLHFIDENSKKYNDDIIVLLGLWKTIGGTDLADLKDLKVLMMGIMGYYQPWMNDPNQQGFVLNREMVKKIHDKYLHLFENRCSFSLYKNVNETENKTTKKRTSDSRRIEDSLLEHGKLREQRIEALREKITAESMKECTFQPGKNLVSSKLLSKGNSFNYEEEGSLSRRYRRMSLSSSDTFTNLFNYATMIKDERRKSFDFRNNDMDMLSRSDGIIQQNQKKTPKINFLEEINDQVPSLYFTQGLYSDVIYENDDDLCSGQSSLMNTPKDSTEILWKMVHTKDVSASSDEQIENQQPFSGFGDTCEEIEKMNKNHGDSYESFDDSFNRSKVNSDKNSEILPKDSKKSETNSEILEDKPINKEKKSKNSQKHRQTFEKNSDKNGQEQSTSEKSSKKKQNKPRIIRKTNKRNQNLEKDSASNDVSEEQSQSLHSGNSEEEEGFEVSVNIKGRLQKSVLKIQSPLSIEADVQAFSTQNKLTNKEKDKLLKHVLTIIS